MKHVTTLLACALTVIIAAPSAAETSASADPWLGEWVLNLQKSTYPTPAPKSGVSTLVATATGIRMVQDQVDAQGMRRVVSFTGAFDGKEYPVDDLPGTTYALRRIDDRIYTIVARRDGVITSTTMTVVSPDGRTRTSTTTAVLPDGRTVAVIAVYERRLETSAKR